MVLLAPRGFGKTATVAKYTAMHEGNHILGLHLCETERYQTTDAACMVKSLAFQIAKKVPEFGPILEQCLEKTRATLKPNAAPKLDDMVDQMLITPLTSDALRDNPPAAFAKSGGRLLLVVDSIHRAGPKTSWEPDQKNELVECVVKGFQHKRLPRWCALLVTTQPNHMIRTALSLLQPPAVELVQGKRETALARGVETWQAGRGRAEPPAVHHGLSRDKCCSGRLAR